MIEKVGTATAAGGSGGGRRGNSRAIRLAQLVAVGLAVGLVLWGTLHESRAVGPFVTVTATGCGGRSLASGFAVGDDLVVTAAHPVAGRRRVAVTDDTGRTRHGFVVALDAALDVAALRVPGLGATPVSLAAGADPNLQNHHGDAALHSAAEHGHVEALLRLLDGGADPKTGALGTPCG